MRHLGTILILMLGISLPSLFARSNTEPVNEQEDIAVEDPEDLPKNPVQESSELKQGAIGVGILKNSRDEETKTSAADLKLGLIHLKKLKESGSTFFEFNPFVFNRVRANEEGVSYSDGVGYGVKLALRDKEDDWSLFVRVSVIDATYSHRGYTDKEEVETSTGASFRFNKLSEIPKKLFGWVIPGQKRKRRQDRTRSFRLSVPISEALFYQDQHEGFADLNSLILSVYMAKVFYLERRAMPGHTLRASSWEKMMHLLKRYRLELPSDRELHLLVEAAENGDQETAEEILQRHLTGLLEFLLEKRYPLDVIVVSETSRHRHPIKVCGSEEICPQLNQNDLIRDYIRHLSQAAEANDT